MEANNREGNAKMESQNIPDWTELTWDCLIDIFSRLNMEERWIAPMFVCKKWMNVCEDPSLNSVFDLEAWFLSSTDKRYRWSFEFSEKIDLMLMSVVDRSKGGLKVIRVRHCTDQSLLYVADRCPNLEVLRVMDSPNVTFESMEKIALKCPKIMKLDITSSYGISLKCIEIFGKHCKNLQIMRRNYVHPLQLPKFESYENHRDNLSMFHKGNIDCHMIESYMKQLKHLELRFLPITDKVIAYICKQCPNLEYLDLFGCQQLTIDGVINSTSTLKNLKVLKKPYFSAFFFV